MMEADAKAESERRRMETDLVVLCNNYGASLKKEQKLDQAATMFHRALQVAHVRTCACLRDTSSDTHLTYVANSRKYLRDRYVQS